MVAEPLLDNARMPNSAANGAQGKMLRGVMSSKLFDSIGGFSHCQG